MPLIKSQVWMNINEYSHVQNALFFCNKVTWFEHPLPPFHICFSILLTEWISYKDYMLFIATFITCSTQKAIYSNAAAHVHKKMHLQMHLLSKWKMNSFVKTNK